MTTKPLASRTRFALVVSLTGTKSEQTRALRAAAKTLLRRFGVKILELHPVTTTKDQTKQGDMIAAFRI